MRQLGALLLFAGILLGLVYPWAAANFFGEEITEIQLTNLDFNAQQTATLTLQKTHNPVRARFLAQYKVDGYLPPVSIPVIARINDRKGALIAGIISFATDGRETGPEQGKIQSGNALDFEVENDGLHSLSLELAPNRNAGIAKKSDIEKITVKFSANVGSIDTFYQEWGIIIGIAGMYLLLRGRRRKDNNPIRWGRG